MKTLHCSDVGFNCQGVIRAENEETLLKQAAEHAREVHHVEVTPDMANKIKTLIRDE